MICSYCNHEQADGSAFCEKCGANLQQQQAPQQPYGQQSPYGQQPYGQQQQGFSPYQQPYGQPNPEVAAAQSKAQTSMILSIVGIFICGIILGIPALVMGLNARKTLQRLNVQQGQGQALAGIIIGIAEIALFVIGIILYVTVIAAAIASI